MGSAGLPGEARWVLIAVLLVAALARPEGARAPEGLPAGPGPSGHPQSAQPPPPGPRATPGLETELGAQDQSLVPRLQVKATPHETAAETPLGRRRRGDGHVSELLPSSTALLAFTPLWPKKTLFKRQSGTSALFGEMSRDDLRTTESRVVFQKCVEGPVQSAEWLRVLLVVNNTRTPGAANLSDLLLLDNITGLRVRDAPGNLTAVGLQALRREKLLVGDAFSVSYMAALDAGDHLGDGDHLELAALLIFPSYAQNRTQLRAPFTITVEEKVQALPDHGLHATGFFLAFILSLALTCLVLFLVARYRGSEGSLLPGCQAQHPENKPEHSQFNLANGVNEDLALNDQMLDILASDDPESMLPALEELEIATLNRADSELEACRTQISKDIIVLLLRNLTGLGHLSQPEERRMGAIFKHQFLLLEKEIQEEYDRKMVALEAECDLETRKKTENQYQREMAAMEEAEEVLKRVSERSAVECSGLLRTLHGLEQEQLQRSLALRREEDLARAHRQLALFQRSELHNIFFAQIQSAICRGELQPDAAEALLRDYSEIQENVEELMDFLQASKRCHLSKRFAHREYLVQNMQAMESRVQGLLNAAATQLTLLIQKHERAGYLDEDQMEVLLERAQTEVFSVKQKLENDLKQEKKRLHQKLIVKRRREMLQKHKEQRKEQLALGEALRMAEDSGQYLEQWRSLLAEQGAALEDLQERLDQAALDELRALTLALADRAVDDLRRLQSSGMTQELLKRNAPWLFLQQILEAHSREMAVCTERLEAEERDRGQEGVQGVRQRLKDDALEAAVQEQAELRHWGRLTFMQLCSSCLSLSEEELLGVRREVQGNLAQMDRSLALPKIRARVLLQSFLATWREAQCLKLDQTLVAPESQHPSKARKSRSKSKSRIDLLKKCIEDKIQLFEEQPPEDLVEKVRAELRAERMRQLEAQEGCFAESLVSLQFQKVSWMTKNLSAYTALLSIQGLLLEELSSSQTLIAEACAKVLDSRSPVKGSSSIEPQKHFLFYPDPAWTPLQHQELQELERKLEDKLALQEAARLQHWATEAPWLLVAPEGLDSERQVSATLQRALSQRPKLLKQQQQSLQAEHQVSIVLEDSLEKMETDALVSLSSQELRLTSYLSKLSLVPLGVLLRLLSLALPSASQPELLAALDSFGQKHPDLVVDGDSREPADAGRQGKQGNWWQGLESRLRGELLSRGMERMQWAHQQKQSILDRPCAPLADRAVFSGADNWPHLALEPLGEAAPVAIMAAEAVDILNTGERLFIFRSPMEPEFSLRGSAQKKKKKNFLNAKKAARALGLDWPGQLSTG